MSWHCVDPIDCNNNNNNNKNKIDHIHFFENVLLFFLLLQEKKIDKKKNFGQFIRFCVLFESHGRKSISFVLAGRAWTLAATRPRNITDPRSRRVEYDNWHESFFNKLNNSKWIYFFKNHWAHWDAYLNSECLNVVGTVGTSRKIG